MNGHLRAQLGGWFFMAALAPAFAQGTIFTCVDAKGRKLTSDRPIAECMDREQKELNKTGSVRRVHGPQLTASERVAQEQKEREALQAKQRADEDRRREKALLARYPNAESHQRERTNAVSAVDAVIAEGNKRVAELKAQRKKLDEETEFYKADPSKTPAKLKRQIEESEQQMAAQQRYVANQEEEKRRVQARFDEERAKLKVMWAGGGTVAVTAAAAAPPAASAAASGKR